MISGRTGRTVKSEVSGSVLMITLSLVCAVFSPVWGRWREAERVLGDTA